MEIDEGSRLGLESCPAEIVTPLPHLPSDDAMAEYYERACERLARLRVLSIMRYRTGRCLVRSRHNLKYWRREPYFGFGAGAHSFNGVHRWANAHDPAAYIGRDQQGRFAVRATRKGYARAGARRGALPRPAAARRGSTLRESKRNMARACVLAWKNARPGPSRMGWRAASACAGPFDRFQRSVCQSAWTRQSWRTMRDWGKSRAVSGVTCFEPVKRFLSSCGINK